MRLNQPLKSRLRAGEISFPAVSAGIIEEIFYRGYAVERPASLTGSYRLGGLIAVAAFGLAHIPGWGPGPALVFLVDGLAATLFYVGKRDLLALIIAHVLGDTIGPVLLPPTSPGDEAVILPSSGPGTLRVFLHKCHNCRLSQNCLTGTKARLAPSDRSFCIPLIWI